MDTKRYKRRPKAENKRDVREAINNEAIARYPDSYGLYNVINSVRSYLSQMGILSYQQVVPEGSGYIDVGDINVCTFKKDVLVVYDRDVDVYHYVDIREPSVYEPTVLFSIIREDKDRFNDRQIKEFLEME